MSPKGSLSNLQAISRVGANIKLSSVATNVLGKSGRAMIEALINGETDPDVLSELAQRRLKRKKEELKKALT